MADSRQHPRTPSLPQLAAAAILIVLLATGLLLVTRALRQPPADAAGVGPPGTAVGVQVYVDSIKGNDSASGLSPESAWRTFAPLHRYPLQPGDTVNLSRGSSWDTGLRLVRSGTEYAPITVRPYGAGPAPALSATDHGGTGSGRPVYVDADWIVIEGLYLHDSGGSGVWLHNGSDHNVVRGCEAYRTAAGVSVSGQHNLIVGNHFHDLVMEVDLPGSSYGAVGVWLRNPFNEVSHNVFVNCRAPSLEYGYDGGAVELYGNADGSHVHHNYVRDCEGFMEVAGPSARGSARNVTVSYNLIVHSGRLLGFHLGGPEASTVEAFYFENNTVLDTRSTGVHWLNYFMDGLPPATALTVRNNIFQLGDFTQVSSSPSFAHEYNLYSLSEARTEMGFTLAESETLTRSQLFDAEAPELHLQSDSPAVGAGLATDGAPVDLGAWAHGQTPELIGCYPAEAPATGGVVVVLVGFGFQKGVQASVGGQACQGLERRSPNQVVCTLPSIAPGSHTVAVTNLDGGSTALEDVLLAQ